MNGSIPLNIILDTIKAGECVQVQYTNQHNGETFQINFNVFCTFYITGEIVTSNTPAPNTPVTNVTIQTTTMRSTASANGIECYVSSILFNTFKYIIYTIFCTSYLFREHKHHLWLLFSDGMLFTNVYISSHRCFISSNCDVFVIVQCTSKVQKKKIKHHRKTPCLI